MYDLGARIKEVREKRGVTQAELAQRINRSVPTISSYETNAQTPPTDILVSIANALNVPINYLLEWESPMCYSTVGLNERQTRLLDLLFREFATPTKTDGNLSRQQMEILREIILLFESE